MIFTTKGLLGNTKINQIYVLSILIDQTYMPDEIIKVSKDIRKRESWPAEGDEIFVKAKEISDLRNKKEYLEQKYKNLREKCLQKEANLKKSIAWKIFFNLLRFADYIFDGYSIPSPLRALLTADRSKPGTIFFPISLNIKTGCAEKTQNSLSPSPLLPIGPPFGKRLSQPEPAQRAGK